MASNNNCFLAQWHTWSCFWQIGILYPTHFHCTADWVCTLVSFMPWDIGTVGLGDAKLTSRDCGCSGFGTTWVGFLGLFIPLNALYSYSVGKGFCVVGLPSTKCAKHTRCTIPQWLWEKRKSPHHASTNTCLVAFIYSCWKCTQRPGNGARTCRPKQSVNSKKSAVKTPHRASQCCFPVDSYCTDIQCNEYNRYHNKNSKFKSLKRPLSQAKMKVIQCIWWQVNSTCNHFRLHSFLQRRKARSAHECQMCDLMFLF